MRTAALTRAPAKASPASSRTTPRPSGLSTARSQDTSAERKLAAPSPILPLLPLQRKLTIGAANDPLESEADAMADRVMRGQDAAAATPSSAQTVRRKCSCEDSGKPCPKCEEEKKQSVQRKPVSPASHAVTHAEAPPIVHDVLRSPGQPLDRGTRSFMESRFGYDLSHVRIHADSRAAESARSVSARAYTVGHNIVFAAGQYNGEYSLEAASTRGLLAHELAHVLQQGSGAAPAQLQCKGAPDANSDIKAKIRKSATYKAEQFLTEQIIKGIDKKPEADRPALFQSLFTALNLAVESPEKIAKETGEDTKEAGEQEETRLTTGTQSQYTGIEEAGSADPARQKAWEPVKGKFAGGTYYIDRRSATDIHIKAKIFLRAAGKGTKDDVNEVKAMQDGIEKAASTFGYSVDIIFVDTKEKDAFDVTVDPGRWEVADNWAGGGPTGYAHELHHLLAFELDKYNYIENQSTNPKMKVHERLIWFQTELGKPADWNDPTSIIAAAEHPNISDVCTVAKLDPKTCQQERQDALKVRDRLLDAIKRSDGTDIFVATEMVPDSLRGPMLGDAEVLTAVDSLPAKARVITRARLQFDSKIPPKVRQLVDAATAVDAAKVIDVLQKNPDLHGPFASPAVDLGGIKAAIVDVFAGDTKKKVAAVVAP
jgi:Domain of unknown function (DUF4157)